MQKDKNTKTHEHFEAIYRETYKYLFAAAIAGAKKLEDAEDILQNVYTAFYRRTLSKGLLDSEQSGFLLKKALRHELYRFYHKTKSPPVYIDSYENDLPLEEYNRLLDEDISDEVLDKITAEKIWNELLKKDDLTVRIFVLRFRLELGLREISELLGISQATVTNRLYRTINELKPLFKG